MRVRHHPIRVPHPDRGHYVSTTPLDSGWEAYTLARCGVHVPYHTTRRMVFGFAGAVPLVYEGRPAVSAYPGVEVPAAAFGGRLPAGAPGLSAGYEVFVALGFAWPFGEAAEDP